MLEPLAEGLRQARSICSQGGFAGQQHVGDMKSICQEHNLSVNAFIAKC